MRSEIITIGDELLSGQVINTNQAFIAEELTKLGVVVDRMTTVGDSGEEILRAFSNAWKSADLVIVTGGLGPTHDDITKHALCTFFETDLISDDGVRGRIAVLLKSRNMQWTQAAEEQTMVPRTAEIHPNPVGTAPGMVFRQGGRRFIVLPGVPYEMKEIMRTSILPLLASLIGESTIVHRTLRTTGIPESQLASQLGELHEILSGAKLAFLPSPRGVRLRISVHDLSRQAASERIRGVEEKIRAKVGRYIYGTEDEELEEVIGRLLTERGLTIAVAESCTGGLIADKLTNVSGSSLYFDRGIVAYSNQSKIDVLGVPESLLAAHGAVSREVAVSMASGIRLLARTNLGVSTTGIAGPTGGSPKKPVGLVWIGYSDASGTTAIKFHFGDGRRRFKDRASHAALELVRRKILDTE